MINGIPLPEKSLNGEEFEEAVLTEIMAQTPTIQKAVYRGDLSDSHNVIDFLMDQPNVMPRLDMFLFYVLSMVKHLSLKF